MNKQIFGLLGTVISMGATSPCANQTVTDIISSNMTLGVSLLANASALISANSCTGTAISCATTESDVVQILADLYSGSWSLRNAAVQYASYLGEPYYECLVPFQVCNCTQVVNGLNSIQSGYNNFYLPAWDNFLTGNVTTCQDQANYLYQRAGTYTCIAETITAKYEACRYNCRLPCCDDTFASQLTEDMNAAISLLASASNASLASCTSGNYSCVPSSTYETLQELDMANALLVQVLDDLAGLYGTDFGIHSPCIPQPPSCFCGTNKVLFQDISNFIGLYLTSWADFSSGAATNCGTTFKAMYKDVFYIQCLTAKLIRNFNVCLGFCSCCSAATQTNITESMNQALSSIDNVWTAYYAQCPGRFNCSSSNLTLVQDDLTQAVAFYDLAIGNYTEFIQDTGFNATCSPLRAECSCRVLGDQLIILNATNSVEYLPQWNLFISKNVTDCIAQAELLRELVLKQKCIADQLNVDYGKCYENCQTNWCLYYNCTTKPCGSGAVWTPPPRSRKLRYPLLT